MSDNELSPEDFVEYDLPRRPLQYCPDYRRELRHFVVVMCCLTLFIGAVLANANLL